MIESFLYGIASAAVLIAVGAVMWRMMLEGMDKRNGQDFKGNIYPQIKQGNLSLAIYHAARLLAISWIVAAVIGRFI